MKKIIQAILILSLSILLPGICTMLITGRTSGNQKKMGVTVTLENGEVVGVSRQYAPAIRKKLGL